MKLTEMLVLAALAAAPAAAQTGTAGKPKSAAAPAAKAPASRPTAGAADVPGVSAEGNAILAKLRTQPDPELAGLIRQQQTLEPQIGAALMAPTTDVDKIADLLRQGEALRAQARSRNLDRVMAAAKALPEADRGPFLRAIAMANVQRGAGGGR